MKIAAEAARELPLNKSYGVYPADTVFGDFRVSYSEDLSELNSTTKFYYSNNTATRPKDAASLLSVAGVGNSPVVQYEGTGAYFLDKLEDGVWRLEVMPDAVRVSDPFAKPSLQKEVTRIYWGSWDMTLDIPDLGKTFRIKELDKNIRNTETGNGLIEKLQPGVYLLQRKGVKAAKNWDAETVWGKIKAGEFVAPGPSNTDFTVYHQPVKMAEANEPLTIEAVVAGNQFPDSVLIYSDKVSFWNTDNPSCRMERVSGYRYRATVPADEVKGRQFSYNIVVFSGNQKRTYPANTDRGPLDWDYTADQFYTTRLLEKQKPVELFSVTGKDSGIESDVLPGWSSVKRRVVENFPIGKNTLHFSFQSDEEQPEFYLRKYIGDEVAGLKKRLSTASVLCLHVKKSPIGLKAGFVTSDGFTYLADCPLAEDQIIRIPMDRLKQTRTALLPAAYPVFMNKYFTPKVMIPFLPEKIESLELKVEGQKGKACEIEIGSIWIE
jgi:hypothetical protein